MTETTKTILIVGGIAVVAWLAYKKITGGGQVRPAPTTNTLTGSANPNNAPTGPSGTTDFWSSITSVTGGLNHAASAAEGAYNSIYDLFGGGPSTSGVQNAPNQTAGSASTP